MVVKVYWRNHCRTCQEVFRYLDEKGIAYQKINVTYDQDRFDEMLRLGGIATPLIVVGETIIHHFDPDRLERLLEG